MPGLRWTPRGAVALPETLQIRVAPSSAASLRAGAPIPGRALTPEELQANLRWFTRPGPRGRPVSALVLSGIPLMDAALVGSLAESVQEVREASLLRVVVHTDGASLASLLDSPLAGLCDQLSVAVRTEEEARALLSRATLAQGAALTLDVVIPLEQEVLPRLERVTRAVLERAPRRIHFTWPFPGSGVVPPEASAVVEALAPVVRLLSEPSGRPEASGLPELPGGWSLKGLPVCTLERLAPGLSVHRTARTSNRWYVDAQHQLDRALLFLPDVLCFSKRESCRFCEADDRCDGVADQWLRSGLVPELVPIRSGVPAGGSRSG